MCANTTVGEVHKLRYDVSGTSERRAATQHVFNNLHVPTICTKNSCLPRHYRSIADARLHARLQSNEVAARGKSWLSSVLLTEFLQTARERKGFKATINLS